MREHISKKIPAMVSRHLLGCCCCVSACCMIALATGKLQAHAPGDSSAPNLQNAMIAPVMKSISSDSTTAPLSEKKISLGGAFLRSALIPGWGQKSLGARSGARNFFVAEVGLIAGVAAFNVYGNWLEDDMRTLASEHAGSAVNGKADQYFVDVGNFLSLEEYNQSRLQNRDVQNLYDPATHAWRWDTDGNRLRFKQLRLNSDRAHAKAELVIAAVLANHIISGIHAAWLARRAKSEPPAEQGSIYVPKVGVSPASGMGLKLTMRWKF